MLVVNTCSFIEPAQQESIDTILEMAEYKKFGRGRRIDRRRMPGGALSRANPRTDSRSGRRDRHRRSGANSRQRSKASCARRRAARSPRYLYHDLTPRVLSTPRHAAYIKIAEGCDHPCTFCIIPQLRGKFRSRRFESVVREAENLAAAGVREVTLIGQDTTSYGEDLGLRDGLAAAARTAGGRRRPALGALPLLPIRTASRSDCSTRLPRTRASQNISTCRCSTPAAACSRA